MGLGLGQQGLGQPGAHLRVGRETGIEGKSSCIAGSSEDAIKIRINGEISRVHAINFNPFSHKYVIRRMLIILNKKCKKSVLYSLFIISSINITAKSAAVTIVG